MRFEKHPPHYEETSLNPVVIQFLNPNLRAVDEVVVQIASLEHFEDEILISNNDGFDLVEIVLTHIRAILLRPIVLPATNADRFPFFDVRWSHNIGTRTRNQLEVIVLQVGCAIEILQHMSGTQPDAGGSRKLLPTKFLRLHANDIFAIGNSGLQVV